jgi:hypothetical protein
MSTPPMAASTHHATSAGRLHLVQMGAPILGYILQHWAASTTRAPRPLTEDVPF